MPRTYRDDLWLSFPGEGIWCTDGWNLGESGEVPNAVRFELSVLPALMVDEDKPTKRVDTAVTLRLRVRVVT